MIPNKKKYFYLPKKIKLATIIIVIQLYIPYQPTFMASALSTYKITTVMSKCDKIEVKYGKKLSFVTIQLEKKIKLRPQSGTNVPPNQSPMRLIF